MDGTKASDSGRKRKEGSIRRYTLYERRELILDAAFEASRVRGSIDISMTELARFAGISRNLLYHHFHSTEAVFKALLERETGRVCARLDAAGADAADGTAEERARRVIAAYLLSFDGHGETLRNLSAKADPRDPVERAVGATKEALAQGLAEIFGAAGNPTVIDELMRFADFVLRLVRDAAPQALADDQGALSLCLDVCRETVRQGLEKEAHLKRLECITPAG